MSGGPLPRWPVVVRPWGVVVVVAHGPEHSWEAADETIRLVNKLYILGHRFEFWPRTEQVWAEEPHMND